MILKLRNNGEIHVPEPPPPPKKNKGQLANSLDTIDRGSPTHLYVEESGYLIG